jgi:hypothetical protein
MPSESWGFETGIVSGIVKTMKKRTPRELQ